MRSYRQRHVRCIIVRTTTTTTTRALTVKVGNTSVRTCSFAVVSSGCAMEYERAGAATRRRERRLRSWWRHERMTVAMELAVATHHSSPKGGWPGATHDALRGQTKASSGGRRPGVLKEPEPPNVVERVLRHTVDQFVVAVPLVPVLDVPVPQMVDTVLDFFRALDRPVVEQVIAVPKISTDRVSQRLVERRLPQMVEQLVEVPTVVSYSSLLQWTVER